MTISVGEFSPTHIHTKSGAQYEVFCGLTPGDVQLQSDDGVWYDAVIYRSYLGFWKVRSLASFRISFTEIPK
jgi:hypothetical protein